MASAVGRRPRYRIAVSPTGSMDVMFIGSTIIETGANWSVAKPNIMVDRLRMEGWSILRIIIILTA